MCTATFLSPAFEEDDHEDIIGNTANLTNADVNRQRTRILKRDFHQRDYSTDIQVFFHHETVLSNLRQTPPRPRLVELAYDETLILTEMGIKVVSSTHLAVSSQEGLLSHFFVAAFVVRSNPFQ